MIFPTIANATFSAIVALMIGFTLIHFGNRLIFAERIGLSFFAGALFLNIGSLLRTGGVGMSCSSPTPFDGWGRLILRAAPSSSSAVGSTGCGITSGQMPRTPAAWKPNWRSAVPAADTSPGRTSPCSSSRSLRWRLTTAGTTCRRSIRLDRRCQCSCSSARARRARSSRFALPRRTASTACGRSMA